ncbi:MAG: SDR family NAD(P)-dependent oxidoreductase, partial [Pseudomonadota bacterium]
MNVESIARRIAANPSYDRLKDRVALISGGANGVGASAARMFSAEGAAVIVLDWDREAGMSLQSELTERGADMVFAETDVSQPDQVGAAVEQALERHGRIDVLFNHAGGIIVKPFLDYTIEDW